MKDNIACPAVESTSSSIIGKGKGSFGVALFKSVKSMQTLIFPFFFGTATILASHSGYCTSLRNLASNSRSTSWFTASATAEDIFLLFWEGSWDQGLAYDMPPLDPTLACHGRTTQKHQCNRCTSHFFSSSRSIVPMYTVWGSVPPLYQWLRHDL